MHLRLQHDHDVAAENDRKARESRARARAHCIYTPYPVELRRILGCDRDASGALPAKCPVPACT